MSPHHPPPPGPPDEDRTTLRPSRPDASTQPRTRARRPPARLIAVLVAGAMAVVLGVIGGTYIAGGTGTEPSRQPSPTPTAPDPAAAVRGFLEAVAAGDAAAALTFAQTQPADTSFITDEVLAAAHTANPITEISVPPLPSADDTSTSVEASYKIGAERVTESYDVTLVAGVYKLEEVASSLDLGSDRSETVAMLLAGREVDSDTVILLPGAYEITSALAFVDWGADNTILVKGPDGFASASNLDLSINDAGTAAFLAATKASLNACLKIDKVKPSGCPFAYTSTSYTIDPKTISWTLTEDPLADEAPRLDYDDDTVAVLSITLRLRFTAKGKTSYDPKVTTIDTTVSDSGEATAKLTGSTVKITWAD